MGARSVLSLLIDIAPLFKHVVEASALQLVLKIAKMTHAHGALVLVDNNIISRVLSHPLELGADIVVNSATKFISGYSDFMADVLSVRGERSFCPSWEVFALLSGQRCRIRF